MATFGWADVIFVMESRHRAQLRQRFPAELRGKGLVVLHIPDDYELGEEALFDVLQVRLAGHLEAI